MAVTTSWLRKCSLTIDHTKVPADQTDYPVVLIWSGTSGTSNFPSEPLDSDGSYPAKSAGEDIRFTSDSAGTIELCFEIVQWTPANDTANALAEIWVKVTNLSSSTDTTIYVWYGNSAASAYGVTATYGRNNTWSNDFRNVYHQNEAYMVENGIDSTGRADGVYGAYEAAITGKVGKAKAYTGGGGSSSVLYMTASDSWTPTGFSVSYWTRPNGPDSHFWDYNQLVYMEASGWGSFEQHSNANASMYVGNAIGDRFTPTDFGNDYYTDETWQLLCFTYSGTQGRQFKDGSPSVAAKTMVASGAWTGLRLADSLRADIDEIQISSTGRSADWVTIDHNNQNSPQTFVTEGTPENTTPSSVFRSYVLWIPHI